MAKIRVCRPGCNFGRWRKLWVYINDCRVGFVGYDETKEFDICSPSVSVYVKMDWYRSQEKKLHILDDTNEIIEILCLSPDSYPNGQPDNVMAWLHIFESFINLDDFFKLDVRTYQQ